MTARLTTLGEVLRELEAADHAGASTPASAAEHAVAPTVEVRPRRVQRKLALLRSIGADGTSTLRAAIRLRAATNAAS